MVAEVVHLFRAPKRRQPMQELDVARAVQKCGLEGCAHARPGGGKRQVLLVDGDTLKAAGLSPGVIRENITTRGLDLQGLATGQRLRVGAATLEISAVCTPCDMLETVRPGLRREMLGRRGMLCRVIEGGEIRRGDSIEVIS